MNNTEIVVVEKEDLVKFSQLFYEELLLTLPEDALMLGAIDTTGAAPEAVGLIIFHIRDDIAFLDWIYVDEDHRRQGVGKALMKDLQNIFLMDETNAVKTIYFDFGEAIEGMGAFLRKNGFGVAYYDGNFNIHAPLKSVKFMKPENARPYKIKAVELKDVPKEFFTDFDNGSQDSYREVFFRQGDMYPLMQSPKTE